MVRKHLAILGTIGQVQWLSATHVARKMTERAIACITRPLFSRFIIQ